MPKELESHQPDRGKHRCHILSDKAMRALVIQMLTSNTQAHKPVIKSFIKYFVTDDQEWKKAKRRYNDLNNQLQPSQDGNATMFDESKFNEDFEYYNRLVGVSKTGVKLID